MSYRAAKLVIDGHTHTHTHAGNDNIRRPKLASGKNDDIQLFLQQDITQVFKKYISFQHIEAETKRCRFADDIFKCSFLNENV